jgi:WD40 repeat protein
VSKDAQGIVVSTLSGHLIVLDNRFLKPVRTFAHSTGPISTVAHSGIRNSVWVSSGSDIGLFDVEIGGEPQQVLSVNQTGTTSVPVLKSVSASTIQTGLDVSLTRLVKSDSNARCVLECNFGPNFTVLSGHNDNVVRYWEPLAQTGGVAFPVQLEPTPVTSIPGALGQMAQLATEAFPASLPNVAGRPCTTTEAHRDIILDMCVASLQYDIVITGGRDGLIKLWK